MTKNTPTKPIRKSILTNVTPSEVASLDSVAGCGAAAGVGACSASVRAVGVAAFCADDSCAAAAPATTAAAAAAAIAGLRKPEPLLFAGAEGAARILEGY